MKPEDHFILIMLLWFSLMRLIDDIVPARFSWWERWLICFGSQVFILVVAKLAP